MLGLESTIHHIHQAWDLLIQNSLSWVYQTLQHETFQHLLHQTYFTHQLWKLITNLTDFWQITESRTKQIRNIEANTKQWAAYSYSMNRNHSSKIRCKSLHDEWNQRTKCFPAEKSAFFECIKPPYEWFNSNNNKSPVANHHFFIRDWSHRIS